MPKMVKTRDNDNQNYYNNFDRGRGSYSRGSSARGRNRNGYYSRRGYPRTNGQYFQSHWNRVPRGHHSPRPLSRPVSPVEGSEEFMARKIQQTSAIIMRQLLSPNEAVASSPTKTVNTDMEKSPNDIRKAVNESIKPNESVKQNEKGLSKTKKICRSEMDVKEIHEKILNRISNLNEGRKKNFINAHSSTSLDSAVEHIHKQKRLEISRVVRDMCSSSKSGELINSIISDIEIKLEELPIDVIQELRQTLNIDLDEEELHPESQISHMSITSDELNSAIDSIKPQVDPEIRFDSVEIKVEDIVDIDGLEDNTRCSISETRTNDAVNSIQETEQNQEQKLDPIHHSFTIKEEPTDEEPQCRDCDSPGTFSQSTVLNRVDYRGHVDPGVVERNELESQRIDSEFEIHAAGDTGINNSNNSSIVDQHENASSQTDYSSISCLENCIRQFIQSNHLLDMSDYDEVFVRVESIEKCVSYLSEHGRKLMKAALDRFDRNKNREGIGISQSDTSSNIARNFTDQSSQTDRNSVDSFVLSRDQDGRITKRRKEDLSDHGQELIKVAPDRLLGNKNSKAIGISQNEFSSSSARKFHNQSIQAEVQTREHFVTPEDEDRRVTKRRKEESTTQATMKESEIKTEVDENKLLVFAKLDDQVTVIEKVDNQLVIATKSGNILYASLKDGSILRRIDASESPITSLIFLLPVKGHSISMYVGSLDRALKMYDFRSGEMRKATHVEDQIRCMDAMWDYIFIGCSGGMLMRYSTKRGRMEFEERNSSADILVIKAAQEGPRRVLLIGHKQAPVYVRDAMSGQYLRNFSNEAISPTVYALLINKNRLYCGTAQNNILVFSFHEGTLFHKFNAGDCKGISCMKIYQDLLFSGCYNGSIYVYHLKLQRLLTILKGPGVSISCMEVLPNQVVVGTLKGQFGSVAIPDWVSEYGKHSTKKP